MTKTSPDLDDGFLQLAHELVAAVACAGFGKWEMIVVREVFDQIYGPKKLRTAHVSPSDLAERLGTVKQSIVRAVGGLVSSGVLAAAGKCEYRFIKNYGTWKFNGGPRFSDREIAYCREAKRKAKSDRSPARHPANESTPKANDIASPGNEFVSSWGTNLFLAETNLLPPGNENVSHESGSVQPGNENVTGGKQICYPGETFLFPVVLPPLEPPIGEPARFDNGNKRDNTPLTPQRGEQEPDRFTLTNPGPPAPKSSRSRKEPAELFVLPDWIPEDDWDAFVDMRKKIRCPLTEKAKKLAVKKLRRFKDAGKDPVAILNEATLRCWRGLFDHESEGGRVAAPRQAPSQPITFHRKGDHLR